MRLQGFYGEVYRGKLMHMYENVPDRIVAVKTVKSTLASARADFDREISIMRVSSLEKAGFFYYTFLQSIQ